MFGFALQLAIRSLTWCVEALAASRHWRFTLSLPLGALLGLLTYALSERATLGVGVGLTVCCLGALWNLNRGAARDAGF